MEKEVLEIFSESPESTFQYGVRFSRVLRPGDVVGLSGELGAGKTVFIQGLCEGLGVKEPVTSPSFVLIQEYRGSYPVYHFDFYRLESPQEIEALDLNEYFDSNGICVVEWAERAEALFPKNHFFIKIFRIEENGKWSMQKRKIQILFPPGRLSKGVLFK